MRNLITATLTVGLLTVVAGAANADTSTYNKYTNTNIYDGYTETSVDAHINSHSVEVTDATSIKVEAIADLGDNNFAQVTLKDGDFSARATSTNNQPIDPVATIYYSEVNQTTTTYTTETVDVNTFSSNSFDGTVVEHEVGTRF